jgi:hypothetical protein
VIGFQAVLAALALAAGGEVVARVDGVVIDRAAVVERRAAFRAQGQDLSPDEVLGTLVDEAVLAAEAERSGLRSDADVAARLDAERRRLAAEAFVSAEIVASISVPDAAIRESFHQTEDFVRLQLLTFETRDAAQASRDRLEKGARIHAEATQAIAARVHPSTEAAPWTMRVQLEPELAKAAFAARPGALVGPVPMKLGFAVAQVLDVVVGDEATFAAKRDALLASVRRKGAAQSRAHLAQQLRAKSGVKLDEAFLRGLEGAKATPADLDHAIAMVNGRPVPYRAIHPAIRSVAGSDATGHMTGPVVKTQLAWQRIDELLLQDVAVERGYGRNPAVVAQLAAVERNVLATVLAERIRSTAPAPTEAEISAFYRENARAYGKPFEQVLPDVAANAAARKREATLLQRAEQLRKKASVTVDRAALLRAS